MMDLFAVLFFWFIVIVYTVVLFPLVIGCKIFFTVFRLIRVDQAVHAIAGLWSSLILRSMWRWKIEIDGKENLPPNGTGYVIVCNHESLTDIWVLFMLGISFRWLSKKEVFAIPLIGNTMHWAGYVPIKRGDKNSHKVALDQSAEWIKLGVPMVFFPEGTRSKTRELLPFKAGAFRLAMDCRTFVVPIALKYSAPLLRGKFMIPQSSKIKISVMPQISPSPDESAEHYADRTRTLIMKTLSA